MRPLFIPLLLFATTLCTLANGGGYQNGVSFTGDIAPFSPSGTEHVQIVDEKLDIHLQPNHAKVSIRYILQNDHGRKAVAKIGFPVEEIESDYAPWMDISKQDKEKRKAQLNYCKNYTISLNGKPIKSSYIAEAYGKAGGKKFPGHEQYLGIKGWLVSKLTIPAQSKAILEISYDSSYEESFYSVSEDATFSGSVFKYRLSTGGVWKSTIKKGTVTVKSTGLETDWIAFANPVNRFKKRGDQWVWEFNELEPTLADDIKIIAKPPYNTYGVYGETGHHDFYVMQRSDRWYKHIHDFEAKASSTLKEKNYDYSASNVADFDEAKIWSEGVEGQGVGESLTLTLKEPQPLASFSINAGHQKSPELYAANSRPKKIELVINGGAHRQTYTLADQMYRHEFAIKDYTKPAKSIQFIIKEVYPGSHYQDTCISSISFTSPLKKAPKRYGAR